MPHSDLEAEGPLVALGRRLGAGRPQLSWGLRHGRRLQTGRAWARTLQDPAGPSPCPQVGTQPPTPSHCPRSPRPRPTPPAASHQRLPALLPLEPAPAPPPPVSATQPTWSVRGVVSVSEVPRPVGRRSNKATDHERKDGQILQAAEEAASSPGDTVQRWTAPRPKAGRCC